VAENARLEHELVVLRQKLQATRSTSPTTASPLHPGGSTVALEMELRRVQNLVGDLQRQRHDLSAQVRQLTEKSQTLAQQMRPTSQQQLPQGETHHASSNSKQRGGRPAASWLETDLDSLHTQDVGRGDSPSRHHPHQQQDPRAPLYVNTDALEVSSYHV
jgi:seryl-tRNA synthetase